ncbi:MAG: DegT/DnrJ/EryC1/StrS family aminotransferase [Deltaproteobacteria bacterium]|nr:DegT/DnrJ/EryC1/StrS family aminotransferase [Deltaproteobacteria bacterium]
MRVPLLDVKAQNAPLRESILAAVAKVVDAGAFILGPEVEAFEKELAARLGARRAVGLSSGTDALLVALMALGVRAGDEVVTTPFSFYATVGCVARLGARPVFADIDPKTFNLDPAAAAAACGPRTRALMPVHLFGRPASLPAVPVPVVEDSAQSIGACRLGGMASCLSFFPSKNLGAMGDGGALVTDDEAFADKVALLRAHGGKPKYVHHLVGGNFRLDAVQAAILRVKLPHLAAWTAGRRRNAERYRRLFAAASLPGEVVLPEDTPAHIYNQFVIRAPRRDALREHLRKHEIGTEVYYPLALHLQPCFADLGYRPGAFPAAERATAEALALPIYAELGEEQQSYVVEKIVAFYREGS